MSGKLRSACHGTRRSQFNFKGNKLSKNKMPSFAAAAMCPVLSSPVSVPRLTKGQWCFSRELLLDWRRKTLHAYLLIPFRFPLSRNLFLRPVSPNFTVVPALEKSRRGGLAVLKLGRLVGLKKTRLKPCIFPDYELKLS
jgi:hypothetical protein